MIVKRGSVYWYEFKWTIKHEDGTREYFVTRCTTRSSNKKDAMAMEGAHRNALAMGLGHPHDPWPRSTAPLNSAISHRSLSSSSKPIRSRER